jgi:hypothetical protein
VIAIHLLEQPGDGHPARTVEDQVLVPVQLVHLQSG